MSIIKANRIQNTSGSVYPVPIQMVSWNNSTEYNNTSATLQNFASFNITTSGNTVLRVDGNVQGIQHSLGGGCTEMVLLIDGTISGYYINVTGDNDQNTTGWAFSIVSAVLSAGTKTVVIQHRTLNGGTATINGDERGTRGGYSKNTTSVLITELAQ